jgi:hypothetical protein
MYYSLWNLFFTNLHLYSIPNFLISELFYILSSVLYESTIFSIYLLKYMSVTSVICHFSQISVIKLRGTSDGSYSNTVSSA